MRSSIIPTILLSTSSGCTLLSITEADQSASETIGDGDGSPPSSSDESDTSDEPELGWCCACGVNVGDALACTPSSAAACEGEDVTWCEYNASGDTSACAAACTKCVCDCELGPSPGCISHAEATACASECGLVWCCACEDFVDDYNGPSVCEVVPLAQCMDAGQTWCSPNGIFAMDNPVFDCWQQCQPAQFGWCCECQTLEQSPICHATDFFNCAEPGWAWCDELDEHGQPTPCIDSCAELDGWCCDCGLGHQGWWECKQSDPETCTGLFEAWCADAPCIEACNS